MKKTTILVLLLVAAMILGVTAAASAASKAEHYAAISDALNKLEAAVGKGEQKAIDAALMEVSNAVYAGLKYLAAIGEYRADAMQIIEYAKAYATGKDIVNLREARDLNFIIFGEFNSNVLTAVSHS